MIPNQAWQAAKICRWTEAGAAVSPLRLVAIGAVFLVWNPAAADETNGLWPPELFAAEVRQLDLQEALTFDPAERPAGRITYELTAPAFVRLRVVRRQEVSFVLRTLLDWTWQPAGPHEVLWDRRDSSGNLVLNAAQECFVVCEANSPLHAFHPQARCHDPRLTLTPDFPTDQPVGGLATFQVALDAGPESYFAETGATLRYYVDGQCLHEVHYAAGVRGPWTLAVDTVTFPDGPHRVEVAATDNFDHRAAATVEVTFRNGEDNLTDASPALGPR